MRKVGTLAISADHVFRRRARDSGAERERRRHAEADGELPPGAQRRLLLGEVEDGGIDHGARHRQDVGDGHQSLTACFGSVAARVDACLLELDRCECRPASRRRRHDRLERMRIGQAAKRSAEREGAEPFRPRVQRRVRRCQARVRRPRRCAQALVRLDVCRRRRRDHREAVVLVRQHVGRQHPEAPFAFAAASQRDPQGPPLGQQLPSPVVDKQHHRSRHARPQQDQRNPSQPRGHRAVEGKPFSSAAS